MDTPKELFSWRPYWAKRFGTAPFLPMSRAEMEALGWDACDVILVTGDAYVDHPSFGMALIGRLLEAHGFRVGLLSQPAWESAEPFTALGRPNLFFGVTAGNMDSMVNRYTADRKPRSDDAYTPGGEGGKRPDRSSLVYAQRCREAYPDVPILLGGIEASLRRAAHYDYWQDKVRRSILFDAKADLLLYGNAERALVEVAHRLAAREPVENLTDIRGTALIRSAIAPDWHAIDATTLPAEAAGQGETVRHLHRDDGAHPVVLHPRAPKADRSRQYVRLPPFEAVRGDPALYAHASRALHLETNPHNARPLAQRHGDRELWINPPPLPLTSEELDRVYELPYARAPHPAYGGARIPAWEMIRFSVNIMRGCFGGCTFCSITEHEGRIIQNRSTDSILREIEEIRDRTDGFTGIISDLGGPTANMYRLHCKEARIEAACRRLSCVYPGICENLNTDHAPLIDLYRRARALPGIKRIFIASGLRYDLAVESPEYIRELATHHTGGYLKVAPEHTEERVLNKMMKPGIASYDRFEKLFQRYSREAGKEQYLIPYFIAAHPGADDEAMLNLALWLKRRKLRVDQVQAFLPSPMALATAMYHSGKNPLKRITANSETLPVARGLRQRRLHKALLRYHDANNWPDIREALKRMGRADLIGPGKDHLVPPWQPAGTGNSPERPQGKRMPNPKRKPTPKRKR